jgi:hypothetical protein
MGVGDPDESLLWLIPPFWGSVVALGVTYVAHVAFLTFDPTANIEAWFERTFGFPEKILAAYGTERMHKDREGTIVGELLLKINEPMTTPGAWIFILFPFVGTAVGLPWGVWQNELSPEPTVEGWPRWAYRYVMVNTAGTVCLMMTGAIFWYTRPEFKGKNRKESTKRMSIVNGGGLINVEAGGPRKPSFFGTTRPSLPGYDATRGGAVTVVPVDNESDAVTPYGEPTDIESFES